MLKQIRTLACAAALCAAGAIAASAAAGIAYKTYTFSNLSNETANDFHMTFVNGEGFPEPVSKARSQAFDDPPQGQGSSIIDWPSTGGGSVAPGGTDRIAIANEDQDFQPNAAFFTRNGNTLATLTLKVSFGWDIDEDGLSYSLRNDGQEALMIRGLALFIDNDLSNYSIGDLQNPYENPSGNLVLDITNQRIDPGERMVFNIGAADIDSHYVLALMVLAPLTDSGGDFFYAAGLSAVPAPGALSLLALVLGCAGLRRSRCGPDERAVCAS